ncbi:hypothetical protein LXL04_007566 [Taraxacum kok-saghyz]
MATSSVTATGFSSSFHGSWGTSMAGEDYGALVAKTTPKLVRIGNPLRYGPMMGNVNEGKGPFVPVVVVTRNIVGKKRFNQLTGKAIALHSQIENLSSVSNDAENSHFWEPLDMSAGPKVEKFKPKAPTRKMENISSEMDYMDNESIPMFSPDELLGSSYNGITDSIPVPDFHVNEEQPPIC